MKRDKFAPLPIRARGDLVRPKLTYKQDSKIYNDAQTTEKLKLFELVYGLVRCLPEEILSRERGRPALSRQDALFCCIMKVYETKPARRLISDLILAKEMGYISKVPHFNSLNGYIRDKKFAKDFDELLTMSAMPIGDRVSYVAIDATGFSTRRFSQWVKEKEFYSNHREFRKLHIVVDTETCMVLAAEITPGNCADITLFKKLVLKTHKHFKFDFVCADKGYLSRENYNIVEKLGARAYIAFKENSTTKSHGSIAWQQRIMLLKKNPELFYQRYHHRSKVEATFSVIKTKFLEYTRSRCFSGQENEILCKLICHNLCIINKLQVEDKKHAEADTRMEWVDTDMGD